MRVCIELLLAVLACTPACAEFVLIPENSTVPPGGVLEVALLVQNESSAEELDVQRPARIVLHAHSSASP